MKIPSVKLSQASQIASERIMKESKKKHSIGEQMVMANYYAYLHSKSEVDKIDYAKTLLCK